MGPTRPILLLLLAAGLSVGCADKPLAFTVRAIPVAYDRVEIVDADIVDHDRDGDGDLVVATLDEFRYLEFVDGKYQDATPGTALNKLAPVDALLPDEDDYLLRRGETLSRLVYSGIGTWHEEPGPVPETPPAPERALSAEADLDGDGRLDRVQLRDGALIVELAGTDGTFTDVTRQVGADGLPQAHGGRRVCAGDLDGDGDVDLLVVAGRLFALVSNGGRLSP